jgi:GT2 family glycosyltransferase
MKNLSDLTVIILTYNTPEKILLDCLKTVDKNVKTLIVENSSLFEHNDLVTKNFSNIEVICTGENLGYGKGNNFGIKHATTDYVLILNPDVICDHNFFSNIIEVTNEVEDFSIIGCQYLNDKVFMPAGFFNRAKNKEFSKKFKNKEIEKLSRVEWVTGCSILINLKEFKDKKIFDENFFLYFEEFDLCKSLSIIDKKVFTSNKLKVHHLGFQSSLNEDHTENLKKINIKNWHYMWSSFYFYKKNYNFLYALFKLSGKFVKSFFKMIFYAITFQKENKDKYLFRFLGLLNSILGKPSKFRD